MPTMNPDDDVYRARLVYLGPPGYTLPVHLSYAQYGVWLLTTVIFLVVIIGVTGDKTIAGFAVALSTLTTHLIFKYVTPDRPARVVVKTAATDWQRIQPKPDKPVRMTGRHIRITEPRGSRR